MERSIEQPDVDDLKAQIKSALHLMREHTSVNADSAYHYYGLLTEAISRLQDRSADDAYYKAVFDLGDVAGLGFERHYTLLTQIAVYAEQREDYYYLMHAYRKLSHLFYHASKLDKSLEYQLKALRVTQKPGMPAYAKVFPYVSLAHIYGDHPEGKLYADTAMAMITDKIGFPPRARHWSFTRIGSYYLAVGKEEEALASFENAQIVYAENEGLAVEPEMLLGFGKIYSSRQNYALAESFFQQAAAISDSNLQAMPKVNIDIAEAMITLARKTRQDSLAEAYALKLINVAIDVDYLKPLMFAHRTLHDLYEQRALSEKAAMHLERYFELKDALDAREKANTDYFQSRALELAQKRHQIDVVEAQLQLQTHRTLIVTVVLLFTSILIIFLFLSRVDHKKNNKILSAKNAQIEEFNQSLVAINEQLNKARKKAEDSDRLKTSILQNMSHETRTPLTSILGYAEMIADNEGDNLEIAAHIKRGGRRLLDTLTSVLDLARLESGDAELKREVFNVATLVQESADTHKPVALNKGINFDVAVKDAAKLEVKADREAVKRVLNNVIHNAVHFTERGCVSILVERVAQDVILHVADTGIGMNTAFLPRAFEPFRQESMGHGRTHEGIGVGLSITKLLVELMNGRITVMSEKGKGSTFTVILPIGI